MAATAASRRKKPAAATAEPAAKPAEFSDLGRVAYEAYMREVGDELPTWEQQCQDKPTVARGWVAAAHAAIEKIVERNRP